jgi:hypothetical protein
VPEAVGSEGPFNCLEYATQSASRGLRCFSHSGILRVQSTIVLTAFCTGLLQSLHSSQSSSTSLSLSLAIAASAECPDSCKKAREEGEAHELNTSLQEPYGPQDSADHPDALNESLVCSESVNSFANVAKKLSDPTRQDDADEMHEESRQRRILPLVFDVGGKGSMIADQARNTMEENVRAQSEAQKQIGDFLGHVRLLRNLHSTARIPSSASTFIALPPLQPLRKSPRRSSSASVRGSFWVKVFTGTPALPPTSLDEDWTFCDRKHRRE